MGAETRRSDKMSIDMKVLEKAIAVRDFKFLSRKLIEKLREAGWTDEDIVQFAEKLVAVARKA
jgi:hypothetical protein